MSRMDVTRAFDPAFAHVSRVLFRPFVFKKWLGMGFVALFAASSGSNFRVSSFRDGYPKNVPHPGDVGAAVDQWIISHVPLIVMGALLIIALAIFFAWLSSVMKLVYVDQIARNSGAIKEPFARLKGLGTSFFLWELAASLVILILLGLLIAIPLLAVFLGDSGTVAKVLVVMWAILAGAVIVIGSAVVMVFGRDFVLPAMYVRNVRVLEGWRVVTPTLKENVGQLALYILFLIVIAIAGVMLAVIGGLVTAAVFLLPGGLLFAIGWALWNAGGQAWSAPLIAYAAVFGTALAFVYAYAVTCVLQPLLVFRRAYALVALGQGDPSLATVPVSNLPPMPPQPPQTGFGPAPAG